MSLLQNGILNVFLFIVDSVKNLDRDLLGVSSLEWEISDFTVFSETLFWDRSRSVEAKSVLLSLSPKELCLSKRLECFFLKISFAILKECLVELLNPWDVKPDCSFLLIA